MLTQGNSDFDAIENFRGEAYFKQALDVDSFAMDNSGTAKEGVGRSYAGADGYCPLAADFGSDGFCRELALRPGVQHSARETDFNLETAVGRARVGCNSVRGQGATTRRACARKEE